MVLEAGLPDTPRVPRAERARKMSEQAMAGYTPPQQYSNSSSKELKNTVTVTVSQVIKNLPDLIDPDDPYLPYYIARYRDLGYKHFMYLVSKARAGGKDPARLFWWMLHNPELVR